FRQCSDEANWRASVSSSGGSPGTINSVFDKSPDTRPFFIERVQHLAADEITVTFSKPINKEDNPEAGFLINKQPLTLKHSGYRSLTFSLAAPMVTGQVYQVEVLEFYDCEGMLITGQPFLYTYDADPPQVSRITSRSPQELKIYFNE